MHRFLHILLLFLLTQATTFAQVDSTAYAHAMADSISVGKSPSDTTTEVVGKLNLVTFEPKEINICLVPVNDVSLPGIQKLEKELNDIFRPAVASVRLSTAPSVKIQYADGRNFVHGGSGPLSVYSADEKSAIKALGTQQSDTYYLFMAKDVVKLDPDGNRTIVGGYMPVGRQFGFIFEQFDVASTIAHELSHGAFSLHHTFSDESESYHAPQGTTPNLMDYSGGTTLNHLQWQWMHESHTNLLGFLDDEGESEYVDFYFYDYFFGQIHSELSSFADGVKSTVAGWFKSQKKEEKPVIPELSDDQKSIIEILKGIHDAEMSYTIRQLGMIYDDEVDIEGHKCQIALHIQPDLEFRLAVNGPVTMTKKAFTRERHDDYTLISFKQSTDDKKIALAIQVDKDNADWLMKYLGGYEYNPDEIVIYITRTNTGEHSTTGTLVTDDGTISGYTVELPRGTDGQCKTQCNDESKPYDCYCIMEGEYEFCVYRDEYDQTHKDIKSVSLKITSSISNGRTGVLVHGGQDDAKGWSKGCILPMPNIPNINLSYEERFTVTRNNSIKQSMDFTQNIVSWVKSKNEEIKKRNPNMKYVPCKIKISERF